jgi:hypothetical protein
MGENELPTGLREALARELDEGENVRWAGVPDADHARRRSVMPAIAFGILCLVLGGFAEYGAYHFWLEATGRVAPETPGKPATLTMVWVIGVVGAFILLGTWLFSTMPRSEADKARRTVYAVTRTRVLSVTVNSNGTVTTESVEPGHPLSIARNEWGPDLGDVHLYPRTAHQGQTRGMSLMNVKSPREVERVIRQTFDPPGVRA